MSDNIDYNELDKAVNEAMSARNAAKAQPAKVAEPKPAAPVMPQKPAAKPVRRGVMMDFAPRHSIPVKKEVKAPAVKVPARPIVKPAPINRLVNRPAVKPAAKTIARPTVAPAKPVSRPAIVKPAIAKPAVKPAAKPAMRPAPTKPVRPAQAAARPVLTKPAAKPAPKPVEKPVEKPAEKKEDAPTPVLKRREAPNGNNYSLGGRSPFVANTQVEKRPLGNNIPETSTSTLRSTHNVYSQKSPTRATENAKKHIITQDPKKKSGWLWTLVVLGVILAGGGLGYLAYLLVFAH